MILRLVVIARPKGSKQALVRVEAIRLGTKQSLGTAGSASTRTLRGRDCFATLAMTALRNDGTLQ
jgi:hypothetical protein